MLMFVAFAQFAFLIFGTQVSDFSTITKSMFTQFRMVLGDFDFPAIRAANPVLGPMYFFVFIFLVFFILMVCYKNKLNKQLSSLKRRKLDGKNYVVKKLNTDEFNFIQLFLQSMFMAILNDTYSEVKEEVEGRRENFQVLLNLFVWSNET